MPLKYAAFFIVDKNDKTLLIRYAQGTNKGFFSGAGGHIEKEDKNCKQAAIRELKEETGIDYHKLEILSEKNWIHNKVTRIFVIRVSKIPLVKLSFEHDICKRIKLKNLKKYPLAPSFEDSLQKNLFLINQK